MILDPDLYRHHLDRFDMTDEQKLTLMTELWRILGAFVDRAFGLLPEQIVLGVAPELPRHSGSSSSDGMGIADAFEVAASQRAASTSESDRYSKRSGS